MTTPSPIYAGMANAAWVIAIATLTLILITAAIAGYRLITRNTRRQRALHLHPTEEDNIRKARGDHP